MRIEIYSAPDLDTCLETLTWDGTLESYLDSIVPNWREFDVPRFVAYVDGELWPRARWAEPVAADALLRINTVPMGGIFKAIGNIIGKLFSFLGFGSRGGRSTTETPQSVDLKAASSKANRAKMGEPVPEPAGRYRLFPDYLTPPRRIFVNKREQWLHFLVNIGPGLYQTGIDDVKVGDTPFTALGGDAEYVFYSPGSDLSASIAAEIWHTAEVVGGTSSGTAGLELTTEPANRTNVDPATYTFSGAVITRGSGHFPEGWGVGTEVAVEYQRPYAVADLNLPPLFSTFTGYFGHLPTVAPGTLVRVGDFDSTTNWRIVASTPVGGGVYTLRFDDPLTAEPIHVTPGPVIAYTFGSNISHPITAFEPTFITVSAGTFETGVTMAARVRFSAGTVYGEWSSEFIATPPGALTSVFEIDIFFPQGLCYLSDSGEVEAQSVGVEYQYRNAAGGPRVTISRFYSDATVDQIGFTEQFAISPVVVMVRARRIGAQSTSTQIQDKVQWYGLKAKLPAHNAYPNWQTMSVSLRSGGRLGAQSENQINVTTTRVLPILRSDGTYGDAQPTRDITAFARRIINSVGLPDSIFDIDEMLRLHAIWTARGDTIDYVFEATTVKEALDITFGAGMGEMTCGDGLVKPVREDIRTEWEQSYSPQNMTNGLRRNITSHNEITDYDGVDVEYIDGTTWAKETVQCRLPGDLGTRIRKVTLDGVTDRTRAWRIGMRERSELFYRRKTYNFNTELDSLNSDYKSYVALFGSDPGYGQSALLVGIRLYAGDVATLTSSEPLVWEPGASHVVAYRNRAGKMIGPFEATPGSSEYEVRAEVPLPWPTITLSAELPHLYFGTAENFCFPSLVTGVSPRGQFEVSVTAVNYDARVYAYDNAFPPA